VRQLALALFCLIFVVLPISLCAAPRDAAQIANLNGLVRRSALIFSGIVLKVEHHASSLTSPPTSSRCRRRFVGVRRGQIVEFNEWGELWQAGERYRTGEQVLLFRYPPSKAGLTSLGGGRSGHLQMDRAGQVLVDEGDGCEPPPLPVKKFVAAIRRSERE
jgi:hypothetical protein